MSNDFKIWWHNEGSGMPPFKDEETCDHVERVSAIAWSNGAFKATLSLEAENTRLKAEVDMLKANCERMSSDFVKVADDHSALKRQVKQLTLGGDELMEIINGFYCPERGLAHDIWQSAKKGKLP